MRHLSLSVQKKVEVSIQGEGLEYDSLIQTVSVCSKNVSESVNVCGCVCMCVSLCEPSQCVCVIRL